MAVSKAMSIAITLIVIINCWYPSQVSACGPRLYQDWLKLRGCQPRQVAVKVCEGWCTSFSRAKSYGLSTTVCHRCEPTGFKKIPITVMCGGKPRLELLRSVTGCSCRNH